MSRTFVYMTTIFVAPMLDHFNVNLFMSILGQMNPQYERAKCASMRISLRLHSVFKDKPMCCLHDVDTVGDRVKLRRIEGRPAEPVIATHRVTDYCCLRVVQDAISWKPGQALLQLRPDSIINRGIHVFMYVISHGQDS